VEAGAAILNDISGLRFEPELADVAAETGAGLVLMHSRGELDTLHSQQPVDDIMSEIITGLQDSIEIALSRGVSQQAIAIDPGIGFGKSFAQNLELIGRLRQIKEQFEAFPLLIGTSRKSFIGRLLGGKPTADRLYGSLATIAVAVANGADIVRVDDGAPSVDTVRVAEAIRKAAGESNAS
jgi:dihydropteroate synthase